MFRDLIVIGRAVLDSGALRSYQLMEAACSRSEESTMRKDRRSEGIEYHEFNSALVIGSAFVGRTVASK